MQPLDAKRVTVSLPPAAHADLVDIAQESGVSVSWVIRYAVESFLRERRTGQHRQLSLPIERSLREGS